MATESLCDRIEEYLDDVLSDEERASMDRHLSTCGECRDAIEEYRRLRRLALDLPPVEIPDDLGFRIRRRLAASSTPPKRRPARVLYPAAFAGVAAAAVLLLAVLLRSDPEPRPPEEPTRGPARYAAVEPADLEASIADWLVQAGNATPTDHDRLLAEAREQRLLARIRTAIPSARDSGGDAYLTAVSDLLVQLENDPGADHLDEEARLVAMVRPR